MKKAAWILAFVFGLAFLGATLMNADLIAGSRKALARGVLRDKSSIPAARYQLVVVLPDTDDSFFRGILDGIREAAPSFESAVQVFRYPQASVSEAARYYEIALRAKVDGLIMYTPRNDLDAGRGERARRNGVIFVPVGTDAPPGSRPGFIGSGSLLQGFEGGTLICAQLGSSSRIGVILPSSGTGDPGEEPLYRGVSAAIKAFPGATIAAVARAQPGVLSGEEAASSLLRKDPSINALFCSSSLDTTGAAQVVVDLNRVGRIVIVGADETPEIRRYIDKGVVAASIVRDSRRIGLEAVRLFSRLKAGALATETVEVGFSVKLSKGAE
ncbi:MAG TPA: substrate-binding domain-containing protein [Rectinemataceae bacterium]|nr:substrate-binding domain-containing protein [Rectinemataceae bacterium]